MEDEAGVRGGHRLADFLEERQARVETELPRVTGRGHRATVDVLEDEVGHPFVVDAGVEQAGDRAVREASQRRPLHPEAAQKLGALEPAADPLDRHPTPRIAELLLGEPDLAHASPSDRLDEGVAPQSGAGCEAPAPRLDESPFDRQPLAVVGGEQPAQLLSEDGVERRARVRIGETRCALGRRERRELVEERRQALPALGSQRNPVHGSAEPREVEEAGQGGRCPPPARHGAI